MIDFIIENPILLVVPYVTLAFLIQAAAMLAAVWVGMRMAKGEPLVEREQRYMEVPELPLETEVPYEIEEPFVSWKPRFDTLDEEK